MLQIVFSIVVLLGLVAALTFFSLRKNRRIGCGSDCGCHTSETAKTHTGGCCSDH